MTANTPTWITKERAEVLRVFIGPFGKTQEPTPEERAEIGRIWGTKPGHYSFWLTICDIANGLHPYQPKEATP